MMHLFINALAASAGGGLTYVRNVIPQFAAHKDVQVSAALSPGVRSEFERFPNVSFVELQIPPAKRFLYEQRVLPEIIGRSGADVLLSAGNFALRKSPVPQILLSRNSLYLSADFFRDLRTRAEYRMWAATRAQALLARRSVHWADVTVAPSGAFASDLERWTGERVITIHHGFDQQAFTQDQSPLPAQVQTRLDETSGTFNILFVSHYNYYRNFETLIRALTILRSQSHGRPVRVLLTTKLSAGANPGAYRPERAARLVKDLAVSDMVVELGTVPYAQLHRLYSRADMYVAPAYTETFAHPLVEAMASGVPIAASDIPVHREICGEAALYFERFSPDALAACVMKIAEDNELRLAMIDRGRKRAADFSWKVHVQQILDLASSLVRTASFSTEGH